MYPWLDAFSPVASYSVDTRGSFLGGKAAGEWSWPLTLNVMPRSRMHGAIPPFPQFAFMAWCLVKAQGQLYLLPLPLPSSCRCCTKTCVVYVVSVIVSICCTFNNLCQINTFILFPLRVLSIAASYDTHIIVLVLLFGLVVVIVWSVLTAYNYRYSKHLLLIFCSTALYHHHHYHH
jgi:hypothetical protein